LLLRRIFRWLSRDIEGIRLWLFVLVCGVLSFVTCVLGMFELLAYLGYFEKSSGTYVLPDLSKIFLLRFFLTLSLGALLEEIVYRLIPLMFAREYFDGAPHRPMIAITTVAIISSIWFGYVHGSAEHIFVQGVLGGFCSIAFLKCGGLKRNYRKALFASSGVHFIYNAIIYSSVIFP